MGKHMMQIALDEGEYTKVSDAAMNTGQNIEAWIRDTLVSGADNVNAAAAKAKAESANTYLTITPDAGTVELVESTDDSPTSFRSISSKKAFKGNDEGAALEG